MVVVLIIGLLLAVAVPSLLGARTRADDAAAKTNLDTAATAAAIIIEFGSDFGAASSDALTNAEPSLSYVAASVESTGPNEISIDASAGGNWTAAVRSNSGTCFAIEMGTDGQTVFESASCAAGSASPPVDATPTNIAPLGTAVATGGTTGHLMIDGDQSTLGSTGWLGLQMISFELPATASIYQLTLWNRTGCCSNRTRDLTIFVSDSPIPDTVAAAKSSGGASFSVPGQVGFPSIVPIDTSGRYVKIFGSGPNTAFQEVEIIGILP